MTDTTNDTSGAGGNIADATATPNPAISNQPTPPGQQQGQLVLTSRPSNNLCSATKGAWKV